MKKLFSSLTVKKVIKVSAENKAFQGLQVKMEPMVKMGSQSSQLLNAAPKLMKPEKSVQALG